MASLTAALVTMPPTFVVDHGAPLSSVKNCSSRRGNCFLGSVISSSTIPSRSLSRPSPSPSAKWFWESASTERTLSLYIHERRAPPNVSLLSIAAPGGQLGLGNMQFGSLLLYDNVIRDAVAEDAKVLGLEAGLVGKTSDASSFYMNQVFSLTTPPYNGSLSLQGRFDPATTSELVITGGTGDYRFARGFATAKVVSGAPDGSFIVIKYDITIKSD